MGWVKLDDRFFTHPKVLAAGPNACLLYLSGLAYCASHLTDGHLSHGAVRLAAAQAQVSARLADRLVEVGLWERADDGFVVHDYLDWNPSRQQLEEQSVRSRRAAHARWNPPSNGNGNDNGNARGNARRMPDALPIECLSRPVPINTSRDDAREPFADDFAAVWNDYPRKLNRKGAFAKYQATRRRGIAAEDLARAVRNYAAAVRGKEPEFILHGATFFGPQERWRDYLDGVPENRNEAERALGWDPSELRR